MARHGAHLLGAAPSPSFLLMFQILLEASLLPERHAAQGAWGRHAACTRVPALGAIGCRAQPSPAPLLMQPAQEVQWATCFPPRTPKEVGLTSALWQPADKHLIAKGDSTAFLCCLPPGRPRGDG